MLGGCVLWMPGALMSMPVAAGGAAYTPVQPDSAPESPIAAHRANSVVAMVGMLLKTFLGDDRRQYSVKMTFATCLPLDRR